MIQHCTGHCSRRRGRLKFLLLSDATAPHLADDLLDTSLPVVDTKTDRGFGLLLSVCRIPELLQASLVDFTLLVCYKCDSGLAVLSALEAVLSSVTAQVWN